MEAVQRVPILLPGERLTGRQVLGRVKAKLKELGVLMGGFSNAMELEVLDSIVGDHATINLITAPVYLALTTVVVTETDTGATITEATYTGYVRKSVAAADWPIAAAGEKHNSATLTFAACTAGSSTIIGWALADNAATGAGKIIMFGTCASTVISTTATPPTVPASALSLTLD